MKKILVAINFSDQSAVIFRYAMKLAQHFLAEVDFAYIHTTAELVEENGRYYSESKSDYLKTAENRLDKFIESHYGKQYHEISINSHVRIGRVSEELPLLATILGSDLLISGKNLQRKFSFFEDTANSLISNCPCPVMTIPENSIYTSVKRIIYASTFLLEDCAAIFELQDWLKIYKGELECINISKDAAQLTKSKRKMAILEKLFPQSDISFRCFISDETMDIERYASFNEGDILCSLHKDRNMFQSLFHTSISKTLSGKSPRPMIVFHQHMLSSKLKEIN